MGTPEFAVASLKRLVEDGHQVCGVFTQPDKPKNRGHKMAFSPVKEYALTVGIPVYQPLKMRDGAALDIVRELAPELIVVAAYGKLLPEDILNMPPYGSINVHSSLLPKYRGAAPINWAILNGERVTGVSIMYMAKELDALEGFAVSGEEYKKPKGTHGGVIDRWYNRKRVGFDCTRDFGGALYSPDLPAVLADTFAALKPMYEYLAAVARSGEDG